MRPDRPALIGSALFAVLLGLVLLGPRFPALVHADPHGPQVRRDLAEIRHDTLRVLVIVDPLTYDTVNGVASGTEWEVLERFARRRQLPIKAVPVDHPDSLLALLQRGAGDILAAQLTPDGWAGRHVHYSRPYRAVAPVRISLKRDPLLRGAARGARKAGAVDTLVLPRFSTFLGLAQPFDSSALPVHPVPDARTPFALLVDVALGHCPAAVVSDALAAPMAQRFTHLRCDARVGPPVPLAFAVRTNSPKLLHALNEHLESPREQEALRMFISPHGTGRRGQGAIRTLPELSFGTDSISPFDSLFQAHTEDGAHDWRLVAALAFKESRFDTSALSHAGAQGLMQMMPSTLERLGHDTADGVGGTIQAATRYLAQLDTVWRASVPNGEQRLKFVLAAYNAGPGHIKDAQRLAERFGLDPQRWDGNVERAILLLSDPHFHQLPEVKNGYCRGHETFWHVRDVIGAFHQFRAKAAP
ncbi:MAG: transglycosylase SLT domain-containing protein [Flavobacteriales bacterium]